MGAIAGSIWHGVRGARNAPKGHRWPHAKEAIRARAPALGGTTSTRPTDAAVELCTNPRATCADAGGFAMWGGLFSTFDCALLAIRQKDDPINPIVSGAITGGVLAARGPSAEQPARGVPASPSHIAAVAVNMARPGVPGAHGA